MRLNKPAGHLVKVLSKHLYNEGNNSYTRKDQCQKGQPVSHKFTDPWSTGREWTVICLATDWHKWQAWNVPLKGVMVIYIVGCLQILRTVHMHAVFVLIFLVSSSHLSIPLALLSRQSFLHCVLEKKPLDIQNSNDSFTSGQKTSYL